MRGASSSTIEITAKAVDVKTTDDELIVALDDGRTISVPLVWHPRLLHASPEQRNRWELIGRGMGIHWPDIDEDLSVEGMLLGLRAPASEFRRFGMQPPKR